MLETPAAAPGSAEARRELVARLLRKKGIRYAGPAAIPRRTRISPCPLSFAQQRLWLVHEIEPSNTAFNMPFFVRLRGPLDVAQLRRTLHALADRHETLRTHFGVVEDEPVQFVRGVWHPPLREIDLAEVAPAAALARAHRARRSAPAIRSAERAAVACGGAAPRSRRSRRAADDASHPVGWMVDRRDGR
jgi:hypothetical protein